MNNSIESGAASPLVSIVIPVFNGSNYLRQALDSALSQTYHNVEILVINDGSTDNGLTEQIARSYGTNIRYYHKPNGGVATALNLGIQNSRGTYISWLSHDDKYCDNKVERQIEYLAALSFPDVVIYTDYKAIDANDQLLQTARLESRSSFDHKQRFLYNMFKSRVHGCSLLIPKKIFTSVGLFDEQQKTTQDYDLWFNFLKQGVEFRHLPEILMYTRWHRDQGTHSLSRIHHKEVEALYMRSFDMFSRDIEGLPPEIIMEIILNFRDRTLCKSSNHMMKQIKQHDRALYEEMYRYYVKPSRMSYVTTVISKSKQLAAAIWNRIKH